jgi:hypothetical protein
MRSESGVRWRRRAALACLAIGRRSYAWHGDAAPAGDLARQGEFTAGDAAAAAAALPALLDAHRAPRIALRLGHAWCRMWMLPWSPQLTGAERWHNFARARFEERYGASADPWCITVAGDLPGQDRLAAAWPEPMRAALLGRREVRSVRPQLLVTLQDCLLQRSTFSGCLAEIDGGSAFLVLVAAGKLRRTRGCRSDALPAALGAEWAALAAAEGAPVDGERSLVVTAPFAREDAALAQSLAGDAAALGFEVRALAA